jgi:hypothetical protein
MPNRSQQLLLFAWGITLLFCGLAVIIFGQGINWQVERISAYRLFPLFGLLAFSIFLSHYLVVTLRFIWSEKIDSVKYYFKVTSWVALAVMLLHPSILIGKLFLDGFGLPPGSYQNNYVAEGMKWAGTLGPLALMMFLAFELTRFKIKPRYKTYIQYLSDLAMVLIIIHGFAIGQHLQSGWFRNVWILYTLLFGLCLSYNYIQKLRGKPNHTEFKEV